MSNITKVLIENNSPDLFWLKPEIILLTLSITTFYRKSFTFMSHGQLIFSSLLGFFIIRFCFNVLLVSLIVGIILQDIVKKIQSYDRQDVFNNVVMYCSLLWLEDAVVPGSQLWAVVLFLSPAQLIRKPHFLKDILRPVRVSLGPVSIITSMTAAASQLWYCFHQVPASGLGLQLFYLTSSLLGIGSVFAAGVFFRPDNSTVLDMFGNIRLNYRDKVNYHAFFNSIVLIVAMFNVLIRKMF